MTRNALALLAGIVLTACGPILPRPDSGRVFTIEHGPTWFASASKGAQKHCQKLGMQRAVHLGSDRMRDPLGADRILSRFECSET